MPCVGDQGDRIVGHGREQSTGFVRVHEAHGGVAQQDQLVHGNVMLDQLGQMGRRFPGSAFRAQQPRQLPMRVQVPGGMPQDLSQSLFGFGSVSQVNQDVDGRPVPRQGRLLAVVGKSSVVVQGVVRAMLFARRFSGNTQRDRQVRGSAQDALGQVFRFGVAATAQCLTGFLQQLIAGNRECLVRPPTQSHEEDDAQQSCPQQSCIETNGARSAPPGETS
jgi:hypothetical protein